MSSRAGLRRGRLVAVAIGALVLFASPHSLAAQVVEHPDATMPGGAFAVGVFGAPEPAQAALIDPAGATVCRAAPFELTSPSGRGCTVFLLAVPSTAATGTYEVVVSDVEGHVISSTAIEAVWRPFKSEDIPLDRALSSLRSQYNERRDREGRRLIEVLGTTNPRAVYQTEPFVKPLDEWIQTSWFGDRRVYLYSDGGRIRALHNGIDYAAPTGAPVYAAGPGVVVVAAEWLISGGTVILEHLPGVYSLYYHLDEIGVQEGQAVVAGTPVGTVGATGLATGPHLHYEVRVSGVAVEPDTLRQRWLLDNLGWFDTLSFLTP